MPEQKPSPAKQVSRRRFLHSLAILGGSAAVPLGFSAAANAFVTGSTAKFRIGVALPAFGSDGALTASLINGLHLALLSAPDVRVEMTHKGPVLSRVKKLSQSGADLIIGAVTPRDAHQVGIALRDSNAVFLNVEPGAHLQRVKDMQANVFHHTLQLWQAHYAAGIAAIARGSRASVLSSFHEAGYDGTAAFIAGYESVGGTVVSQAVSRVQGSDTSLAKTVTELQRSNPDFIYVNASGARAAELVQAVGAAALPAPFAQTSVNTDSKFAQSYQKATGREADAYALLGYESGQLILAAAANQVAGHSLSLRNALARTSFTSPRGLVQMQADTQTTAAATYVNASGGTMSNLVAVSESQARAHASWSQAVSGWSLPYGAGIEQRRA